MSGHIEILIAIGAAITLDVVSGLAQAVANRTLSSGKLRSGIYHKSSYILVIALALFIEYASQHIDLGFSVQIFPAVAVYIILTEIVSVAENATKLNPELKESPLFKLLSENQKRRADDD